MKKISNTQFQNLKIRVFEALRRWNTWWSGGDEMWRGTTIYRFRISKLWFWRHWGGGRHDNSVSQGRLFVLAFRCWKGHSEGVCSRSGASQLQASRFLPLPSSLTLLFDSLLGFRSFLVCLRNMKEKNA